MTLVASSPGAGSISRAPRPSSLADVLDLILDKGLVIDAYVRVSVAGIEVLTVDARVVIASVDTYLRFAEAVNRLDVSDTEQAGIQALTGRGSSGQKDKDDSSQSSSRDNESAPRGERSGSSRSKAKVERGSSSSGRDNRSSDDGGEESGGPGLIGRLAERGKFDK